MVSRCPVTSFLLGLVLVLILDIRHVESFTLHKTTSSSLSVLKLSSSAPSPAEGGDDDEISKLIGKRSQIKRKKKEEPEEEVPYEPVVDLDLDRLPEFKTERPVRRAKKEEDDNEETEDDDSKSSDVPIVDFKADYEDENDFHIPNRIGVTTVAWGDPKRNFVASGKLTKRMIKEGKFVPGDLQLAHSKLLESGITLFQTSPTYGAASKGSKLSALDIVKRCLEEAPEGMPESMVMESLGTSAWIKGTPSRLAQSLYDSVEVLETSTVELFTIPKSLLYPTALISNALAAAIESGCANHVGVEGVTSRGKLSKLQRQLESKDVVLTSNTFEFSLTNRKAEHMFDVCKDFNVIPIVSNVLDGGLASGQYTASNPSGGKAGSAAKFSFKQLEKLQPLHSVQESIAERVQTRIKREMRNMQERYKPRYGPPPKINTDITTTQVALNYVIAKGGVPLVEVNTPKDAEEVVGSLGWTLTDDEVDMLDNAASLCNL